MCDVRCTMRRAYGLKPEGEYQIFVTAKLAGSLLLKQLHNLVLGGTFYLADPGH
jgi:hypothetical protein